MPRYGESYRPRRVWMGGGGMEDGDSDVEYGYSAGGFRRGNHGGRSLPREGRGGMRPSRSFGDSRYAMDDFRNRPEHPAGYGYGFRRGYDVRGGFGGSPRGGASRNRDRSWMYDRVYPPRRGW